MITGLFAAALTPVNDAGRPDLAAFDRLPANTLIAVGGDSLPALLASVEDAANTALRTSGGPSAPRVTFQFERWLGGEFALTDVDTVETAFRQPAVFSSKKAFDVLASVLFDPTTCTLSPLPGTAGPLIVLLLPVTNVLEPLIVFGSPTA